LTYLQSSELDTIGELFTNGNCVIQIHDGSPSVFVVIFVITLVSIFCLEAVKAVAFFQVAPEAVFIRAKWVLRLVFTRKLAFLIGLSTIDKCLIALAPFYLDSFLDGVLELF
jgi:hypothetical protein